MSNGQGLKASFLNLFKIDKDDLSELVCNLQFYRASISAEILALADELGIDTNFRLSDPSALNAAQAVPIFHELAKISNL